MENNLLSDSDRASIEAVLSFWFGVPARDEATLLAKFTRWYQGGAAMDAQVRERFLGTIERALAGELDAWAGDGRGRLALIVVLDQLTRNVFRDTPRAYAGDARARSLALESLESGAYLAYPLEERLFITMPLVHAEDVALLTQALALADEMVTDAEPGLRPAWQLGKQRVEHYRTVIVRFGRYPHRNAVLGRVSSLEELAFLAA